MDYVLIVVILTGYGATSFTVELPSIESCIKAEEVVREEYSQLDPKTLCLSKQYWRN